MNPLSTEARENNRRHENNFYRCGVMPGRNASKIFKANIYKYLLYSQKGCIV